MPESLPSGERDAVSHIRHHIEFLTKSLTGLASQSSQKITTLTQLKDKLTLYRWSLYDFREATQRYADIEERLFEKLLTSTRFEELIAEHKTIQEQLDKAIALAENAVYTKMSEEELNKCASDIRKVVNKLSKFIEAHSAKQDKLWKQV